MVKKDNVKKVDYISDTKKLNEVIEEIDLMIEYMNSKWKFGFVELINNCEFVLYGDDFMSELYEFIYLVESALIPDEEFSLDINAETFIKDGLPGFRYYTEHASVKFAYSYPEEPPLCINKPYDMIIEWLELDYNLG